MHKISPIILNKLQSKTRKADVSKLTQRTLPSAQNVGLHKVSISTIIAYYATGILRPISKLDNNIPFSEASNLEEAKEFANKFLKIPQNRYQIYDIELVNYLNEAISTFNNNSKTHNQVINYIDTEELSGARAAMRSNSIIGGYLTLDLEKIYTLDESINKIAKEFTSQDYDAMEQLFDLTPTQKQLIKKFRENPEMLSLKEKIHLYNLLPLVSIQNVSSASIYADILSDPSMKDVIQKEGLPKNIDEFIALDEKGIHKITETLFKKYKYKIKIADSGPFGLIYHEIGHKLHKDIIGKQNFRLLNWHRLNSSKTNYTNGMLKFLQAEKYAGNVLAGKLGFYALTSPLEFVAETFSCIANKQELNDTIMEIYAKYKGPMP